MRQNNTILAIPPGRYDCDAKSDIQVTYFGSPPGRYQYDDMMDSESPDKTIYFSCRLKTAGTTAFMLGFLARASSSGRLNGLLT